MGDLRTRMPHVGFVGVGEVGSSYARTLVDAGLPPGNVRVLYLADHPGADPSGAAARAADLGVALFASPADFAAGLDLVVSAVTPHASLATARRLGPHLSATQTYLDLNSTSPATKRALAEFFAAGAAQLVDGAIMGAPADSGVVSFSVAGERAQALADMLSPYYPRVDVVGTQVGDAATIKMTRSVVMKGLAMLLLESLGAARQAGVEDAVLAGLESAFRSRGFAALVTRLVCGSLQHAARRVQEMDEVSEFLHTLGAPAAMTRVTRERLAWLASLSADTPWRDADLAAPGAALDAVRARMTSQVDEQLVAGAIDMHVHFGPDPVVPRRWDIDEGARRAAAAGMGGFVVKSHSYDTSALAAVVRARYPGLLVAGGIALDPPVGGLNRHAVEVAALLGGRIVWLPTQGRLSVMSEDDPTVLAPELNGILELVRDHNLVLASGHVPADELRVLVPHAFRLGVRKIVVTHAMGRRAGSAMSVQQVQEFVDMGAFIEHCYTTTLPPKEVPVGRIAEAIRATGPQRVVLSTDLGKRDGADPAAGFATFMAELLAAGISREWLGQMTRDNPAYLLAAHN